MISEFLRPHFGFVARLPLPVAISRKLLRQSLDSNQAEQRLSDIKQLLIDVSVIVKHDARTGIQRVVRALLNQIVLDPPPGYRVHAVFASRNHGYCYVPEGFQGAGMLGAVDASLNPVRISQGDIFVGLDLTAHLLPLHTAELTKWKSAGVKIVILIYDLLPLLHPEWFNKRTSANFRRWLHTVAVFSNSVVCISNDVKRDVEDWFVSRYKLAADEIPVTVIPLGTDIMASLPSQATDSSSMRGLGHGLAKPTVLMVGTLEPRKGHEEVLDAFEMLWQSGNEVHLIIVGKAGWKTEPLQKRILAHFEYQRQLFWLEDVADTLLVELYMNCTGVMAASYAEGYGLPLAEAIAFGKPVLARDIPVFREVSNDFASFFKCTGPVELASVIGNWLEECNDKNMPRPGGPSWTWHESSRHLLHWLIGSESGEAGIAKPVHQAWTAKDK